MIAGAAACSVIRARVCGDQRLRTLQTASSMFLSRSRGACTHRSSRRAAALPLPMGEGQIMSSTRARPSPISTQGALAPDQGTPERAQDADRGGARRQIRSHVAIRPFAPVVRRRENREQEREREREREEREKRERARARARKREQASKREDGERVTIAYSPPSPPNAYCQLSRMKM